MVTHGAKKEIKKWTLFHLKEFWISWSYEIGCFERVLADELKIVVILSLYILKRYRCKFIFSFAKSFCIFSRSSSKHCNYILLTGFWKLDLKNSCRNLYFCEYDRFQSRDLKSWDDDSTKFLSKLFLRYVSV